MDSSQRGPRTTRRQLLALAIAQALASGANAAVITVNTESDVRAENGQCALREAVEAVNSPGQHAADCPPVGSGQTDEIVISRLEQIQLVDSAILIDSEVSILAEGNRQLPIVAAPGSGIFRIGYFASEFRVDMENLHLSGGSAITGGAISVSDEHVLTLTNCTVTNNSASSKGGGIYAYYDVTLVNTIVRGNQSGSSGGGVFSNRAVILDNSQVTDNTAANSGGGIYAAGAAIAGGSTIADNVAVEGSGGGVFIRPRDSLSLTDSVVTGNKAATSGGGLYVSMPADQTATLENCQIYGNVVSSGDGGGLFTHSTVQLTNCQIAGNGAYAFGSGEGRGGGVYGGRRTINQGGVFTSINSNISITDSGLVGNTATLGGGGFVYSGTMLLEESTVANNSADVGGGLYNASNGTMTVRYSIIDANRASSAAGLYAAYLSDGLQIETSTLSHNVATVNGGAAVSIEGITLDNSTVSGNTATTNSGVVGKFATIRNSTFADNVSSPGFPGALLIRSNAFVSDSLFAGSTGPDCSQVGNANDVTIRNSWIADGTCAEFSDDLRTGDPDLGPLSLRTADALTMTHEPLSGSPLIDAGDPDSCFGDFDQTGVERVIDGNADGEAECDIGSVEFIDVYPPLMELRTVGEPQGSAPLELLVRFEDVDGTVDSTSIDGSDFLVTAPGGEELAVSLADAPFADGNGFLANYELAPPGGTWGNEDAGEYFLQIQDNEVFDTAVTGSNPIPSQGNERSFILTFPEIDVVGSGMSLVDGDVTPSSDDGTDFGDVVIGSSLTRVFEVTNTGTAPLTVTAASLSDTAFEILNEPVGTIPPESNLPLEIRFSSIAESEVSTLVSIASDDNDEAEFNFLIAARGVPVPVVEIAVSGNGTDIDDGDSTPSMGDGTDFGPLRPGQSASQTFTIANQGTGSLELTGDVQVTGSGYSVSQQPTVSSLPPQNETEFVVTFAPQIAGSFSGTVSVPNNDADENPYDFALAGEGVANLPPVIEDATFSVLRTAPADTVVGQIIASDPDGSIPETGAYEILSGNTGGAFSVDDDGVLRVADPLALLENFDLTVSVADDEGLESTASFAVTLIDDDTMFADGFE